MSAYSDEISHSTAHGTDKNVPAIIVPKTDNDDLLTEAEALLKNSTQVSAIDEGSNNGASVTVQTVQMEGRVKSRVPKKRDVIAAGSNIDESHLASSINSSSVIISNPSETNGEGVNTIKYLGRKSARSPMDKGKNRPLTNAMASEMKKDNKVVVAKLKLKKKDGQNAEQVKVDVKRKASAAFKKLRQLGSSLHVMDECKVEDLH
jgi:hypothetical protein